MSTVGRRLLSALVREGNVNTYLKMSLTKDLFREGEVELFTTINAHLGKYGTIPKQFTIEGIPGMEDAIVDAPEPAKFYLEETEKRYLHTSLKAGVQEVSSLLTDKMSDEALAVFTRISMEQYKKKQRRHVTDFRDALGIVMGAYNAQKTNSSSIVLPFGWDSLDEKAGGMRAGDFISIVGRPMMGKTFMMLYTAHHGWKRTPRRPLMVSMEMHSTLIHQRLAAMEGKIKLTQLIKAELSTAGQKKLMEALAELKEYDRPFWVVDGNVVKNVDDLEMQCNLLQPDCLWVDAAYLLKKPHPKMGKWDAQSENAEMIKERIATNMEMPVICSYQLSKDSAKAKKKDKDAKPTMEDIYGSDAIAQLSSVILGLFEREDDVEAMRQRTVELLKGRSGETGSFKVNWDFDHMDFSEVKHENAEDVQMGHMG
jgi:replicative DNA helicase